MDYLTLLELKKIKTFILALQSVDFNLARVRDFKVEGQTTGKTECLNLLRTFPDLKGDQFKNDEYLVKYLKNPLNMERALYSLAPEQQIEFKEVLEKPVTTEAVGGEAAPQGAPAEQVGTAGQATGASTGGLPFGIPGIPSVSSPVIHPAPRVKPPAPPTGGMEGGTGEGTAATRKISKLQAAGKAETRQTETALSDKASIPVDNISVEDKQPVKGIKSGGTQISSSKPRINFPAFRSKIGGGIYKRIRAGLEEANPLFKKAGNGLVGSLSSIANPGGMGGGAGSRSIFGRFSRFGRGARNTASSAAETAKKRGLLTFLLIILASGFLVGFINISAPAPTGTVPTGTTPVGGGGDIASCKFTRGQENPKEATFQSNTLLGYIQEASQKSTIPPAVLAAFIRVESPSVFSKSNDEIANYAVNCSESPTGTLGIMQIQPPGTTSARGDPASCDDCIDAGAKLVGKTVSTMTKADYCDPRTSIIVGAGWILKKMNKLGYGDGTKWDPSWTNNRAAIQALVNTYYGCFQYGGPADCTGPFNYIDDVWTSIQNCQAKPAVNNPIVSTPTDCPIPNGSITCGSEFTPVNGCGHCGIGYPPESTISYCGFPGTHYAIDVAGNDLQPVFLPKVGGSNVNWAYVGEEAGRTEAIQKYVGSASINNTYQTYYLQFHHTQPGSGNPAARQSGDVGGRICGDGCGERHVHIQIGSGGDNPGNTGWQDAAQYFCRQ